MTQFLSFTCKLAYVDAPSHFQGINKRMSQTPGLPVQLQFFKHVSVLAIVNVCLLKE